MGSTQTPCFVRENRRAHLKKTCSLPLTFLGIPLQDSLIQSGYCTRFLRAALSSVYSNHNAVCVWSVRAGQLKCYGILCGVYAILLV